MTPFRTKRGLFLEELEAIFVVNFFHLICFLRTILQCWTVCTNTCLYLECTVHVLRRFVMNHLMEVSINCHKIINGFKKDIAVGLCFVYICTGLNMPITIYSKVYWKLFFLFHKPMFLLVLDGVRILCNVMKLQVVDLVSRSSICCWNVVDDDWAPHELCI